MELIIGLLFFSLLESYIKKSQVFINLVNQYIHPLWYFKRFRRIYDEPVFEEKLTMFSYHPHSVFGYCKLLVIAVVSANLNAD